MGGVGGHDDGPAPAWIKPYAARLPYSLAYIHTVCLTLLLSPIMSLAASDTGHDSLVHLSAKSEILTQFLEEQVKLVDENPPCGNIFSDFDGTYFSFNYSCRMYMLLL